MKRSKKNIVIISILALLVTSVCAGVYFYKKGPLDVRKATGQHVSAVELYAAFLSDSTKANKKYVSNVLVVQGEITRVSENARQQKIVLLKTANEGAYVNCTLEETPEQIVSSGLITIKGLCSGIGQGDADLGITGDVYLTRGYIQTNH